MKWFARKNGITRRTGSTSRPPIEVHNEIVVDAAAELVWDLLRDVDGWPTWHRGSKWVRRTKATAGAVGPTVFTWKAHPIVLRNTVVDSERPRFFAFIADAPGLHALHTFTMYPGPCAASTVVVSHETQVGWLPWLGRVFLAPRLNAANRAWLIDLSRTASTKTGR